MSAGTGKAAASSHGTRLGFGATAAAGAASHSAHAPWSRSGTGWVSTSSPGASVTTFSPTDSTTPAASTPSAMGGCRPTSHCPLRTNSSQFATPAARTEITSSSGPGEPGAASSSMRTSPPNLSMPAARIVAILRPACGGWLCTPFSSPGIPRAPAESRRRRALGGSARPPAPLRRRSASRALRSTP